MPQPALQYVAAQVVTGMLVLIFGESLEAMVYGLTGIEAGYVLHSTPQK